MTSKHARAALAAARVRGRCSRRDQGWRPTKPPCALTAAVLRVATADRIAHRLMLEIKALRSDGISTHQGLARALNDRSVPHCGAPEPGRTPLSHGSCSVPRLRPSLHFVLRPPVHWLLVLGKWCGSGMRPAHPGRLNDRVRMSARCQR